MSTTKPTIVIIPGAWHTPRSYGKLILALEQRGYPAHAISLPTVSEERPPTKDLKDDTKAVHDHVESLCNDGHTVLVVAHSYGGQVASNALSGLGIQTRSRQNLSGGVARLVYMCAYALPVGKSAMDPVREAGLEDLVPVNIDIAEDESSVSRNARELFIGPEVSDAEAAEYVATLGRWNNRALGQKIEKCAWRDVDTSYIIGTNDLSLPAVWQRSMAQHINDEGRLANLFEIEAGHAPHFTATEEVVEILKVLTDKLGL